MTDNKYQLDVQPDIVEKLAAAKPIPALCEFVWNALDADATEVSINIVRNELGLSEIVVQDNGLGMSHLEAKERFQKLGGSWKKPGAVTDQNKRSFHGKEGKGRFKGFALGQVIDWQVIGQNGLNDNFEEFTISILKSDLSEVRITDPRKPKKIKRGVSVRISEIEKDYKSLEPDLAVQALSEMLALYLTNYSGIKVLYNGEKIDPKLAIKDFTKISMPSIWVDDEKYPAELEILEWTKSNDKLLYLCSADGFPLAQQLVKLRIPGFSFSAYLKTSLIEKFQEDGILDLAEMQPELKKAVDGAKDLLKDHFRSRAAEEARTLVDKWKEEEIYPYKGEPSGALQEVEQKVFDIVATNVNEYLPDFGAIPKKQRALHLKLLKNAIEKSPDDLQIILNEVVGLPKKRQEELAELLQESSLSSIISASKLVADRLRFLTALDSILFAKETRKVLKERSQLHKMLEDHTWVFGEEFNLSVSDKSLSAVLKEHLKVKDKTEITVDDPVKRIDGSKGIVDLMLTRVIKSARAEEPEHLIVELKAPNVIIGQKEIGQIESYAFAVKADPRFKSVKTRWNFWILSTDMNEFAETRANTSEWPKGVIHRSSKDGVDITIWVKTWSEVINDNKARLNFIKEKLEYQADNGSALKKLKERYKTIIDGTKVDDAIDVVIEKQETEDG